MKGFWQHSELINQLNATVNELKLLEVTSVEHELVTGVDEEGKEVNMVRLAASISGILQHGGLKRRREIPSSCFQCRGNIWIELQHFS